jgi:hypothetical protein
MGDSYLVVFLEMSVEGEKYFEANPGATISKTNRKFQDIWQKDHVIVSCSLLSHPLFSFQIFLKNIL